MKPITKINTPKGAIVFMLQQISRMSPSQLQYGLQKFFNFDLNAEELFSAISHLQDRNIISVCGNGTKTCYKMRKVRFSELEVGQVFDVVGTEKIMIKKFEEWKSRLLGD